MIVLLSMIALATPASADPEVVATARDSIPAEALAAPPVSPPQSQDQDRPHGLSTDQQIDRWLASRATESVTAEGLAEDPDAAPRVRGEVSVGVGTGGYRDYGAAVTMPLGENGVLALSYRQTENGRYAYGYGDPYFDGGHVFPGVSADGQALEYERRLVRPHGLPDRPMLRQTPIW